MTRGPSTHSAVGAAAAGLLAGLVFILPPEGKPPAAGAEPPRGGRPAAGPPTAKAAENPARPRVGPNVRVSRANAEVAHHEVVLAADPADPRVLVAASMYHPPPADPAAPKIVVYRSADGGAGWEPVLERTGPNPRSFADPAFAHGPDGALYFANMSTPSVDTPVNAPGWSLQVARSADGGKSWGEPAEVKGFLDRPFLAADCGAGKYKGRLYCATEAGVLASADAGKSFGAPRSFAARPKYRYVSGFPVVLSDGTLVVVSAARLRDEPPAGQAGGPAPRYVSARSSADGGASFSDEEVLAESRVAGREVNVPAAAADPGSEARKDHVYAVWLDKTPGGRTCVVFARSADKGRTFPEPVVLSEPAPAGTGHDASLPCVAVNRGGVVGVSWYDTRDLGPEEAGWDVRFRASADGGETWAPSVRVTDYSVPAGARRKPAAWAPGHTAGLAADAAGAFHPLWIDARTGIEQAWTAAVEVGPR